ncbi:hypothetical protein [Pedobacter sp. BMA]|uniref:hypothetical protein n=1 Tax=Pedobacter sp. BMA TaxID=1663685 RepID=UPI00064B8185|nr:hypothetical protein [Pedobacter sp. BMA]KLT66612.1 hypothetical protein AB669_05405 [Pedobacter sp. BMA]
MRGVRLSIFAIFLLVTSKTFSAEGCLVGNTIYSTRTSSSVQVDLLSNGMNVFKADSPIGTNNCISGTIMGTCQVCHGNPTVGISLGGVKILLCTLGLDLLRPVDNGIYYSSYILECNLDDYSWLFGAYVAMVGLLMIRRKSLSKTNI